MLISCVVVYGDLILPIKQLAGAQDRPAIPLVQLVLNCFLLLNNVSSDTTGSASCNDGL